LKNGLLLVFQKRRFCLDTKRKCQYDNEVHRQKNGHIEDDLILILKNSHINDTRRHYLCQTEKLFVLYISNCAHYFLLKNLTALPFLTGIGSYGTGYLAEIILTVFSCCTDIWTRSYCTGVSY
jgi:hypothetical protein